MAIGIKAIDHKYIGIICLQYDFLPVGATKPYTLGSKNDVFVRKVKYACVTVIRGRTLVLELHVSVRRTELSQKHASLSRHLSLSISLHLSDAALLLIHTVL